MHLVPCPTAHHRGPPSEPVHLTGTRSEAHLVASAPVTPRSLNIEPSSLSPGATRVLQRSASPHCAPAPTASSHESREHFAHRTGDHECRHRYLLPYWGTAIVSAVADESKPNSKHPPQDPAQFLPRLSNTKDLSQAHDLLPSR
ncbi:hypothetical protein MRX96_000021 [Rhipicephalus microplus]